MVISMMTKKKLIYSFFIVVLTGGILLLYNAFNGNPISKFLAKKELKTYLAETYPDEEFYIEDGFYNFKFGSYDFNVVLIGEEDAEYEVTLTGFIKPEIWYDDIYDSRLDEPLIEKLSREASEEVLELLEKEVDHIVALDVEIEVSQGTYPKDTSWNKSLTLEKPLNFFIVLDSTTKTKEDTLQSAIAIQTLLNEARYDYERVTINGNILDEEGKEIADTGYVKYALSFGPNTKLKIKDISDHE